MHFNPEIIEVAIKILIGMEPRAYQSPQELLLPHSSNFYSQFLVIDLLKFLIVIKYLYYYYHYYYYHCSMMMMMMIVDVVVK